jgi:hypothetical protein
MASPEDGFPDPNAAERGQNALAMFGPMAEAAAPNLLRAAVDPRGTVQGQAEEFAIQAPFMVAGPPGRAAKVALTATRAAALPAYLGLSSTPASAGAAKERKGKTAEGGSEEVKKLQEKMRAAGLYSGPIDGRLDPGGPTMVAKEKFDKLETERLKIETELKKVEAGEKETQRLAADAERKKQEREEGSKRLREMDENESGIAKFAREYGPMIGTGIGMAIGGGTRYGMTKTFKKSSEEAAKRTDKFIASRGDVPSRVGGVNRFWQEGGAKVPPFKASPKDKFALKSNAKAPSATTLYPPPSVMSQYVKGRDVGVLAGAGADVAGSQYMASKAFDEMQEAQRAVSSDPSEANIQRLQDAKTAVAMWESIGRLGMGAGLGYFGSAPKLRYTTTRPNVGRAEAERARLDEILKNRTAPKKISKPRKATPKQ